MKNTFADKHAKLTAYIEQTIIGLCIKMAQPFVVFDMTLIDFGKTEQLFKQLWTSQENVSLFIHFQRKITNQMSIEFLTRTALVLEGENCLVFKTNIKIC